MVWDEEQLKSYQIIESCNGENMAKLYRMVRNEGEISSIDQDIRSYIEQNSNENFDEIISKDKRWDVFFHLSQMRTSLFNWYEFKNNASILEIGGGFGALTGVFCDRCRAVTVLEPLAYRAEGIYLRYRNRDNLIVYAGGIEDVILKEKFDYIILAGGLEKIEYKKMELNDYAEYVNKLASMLKSDGKLLLAVDNQYGLRYFCGAPERNTGKPFRGLNQYPDKASGRTFGRKKLIDIIEAAGFTYHKFYYPLPDYIVPQLIYSEQYLPKKDVCERLVFYYENMTSIIVDERELYADIIDNQVFEFFANSFLVECGWTKGCSVIYGALTTDRGAECALATTIHLDGIVKKKALYKEGIQTVQNVYKNIRELEERGIEVVPHLWEERGVSMPFVDNITFSDYLRSIVKNDPELFEKLLEDLYQQILRSSDIVEKEKNVLCNELTKELDFGPILQKAYIDMVPFNCFYIKNQLVFFDQEFTREYFPAKYVLFRALKYTYLSIPFAENFVPLEKMKKRYSMEALWPIFTEEEDKFVTKNRRYELYQNFYSRTWLDLRQVYNNAEKLLISST